MQCGAKIWQHRTMPEGYNSGTIRYEVLRRAKFRCELCGISAEVKSLAVDHIIPRNKEGSDDPANFQALCYSCNAMKRDRDDTDFRKVPEAYQRRESGCIFCELPGDSVILQNELCAFSSGRPSSKYSVTWRLGMISMWPGVQVFVRNSNAVHFLLEQLKRRLQDNDSSVKGFNIGVNCGEAAGQTILHSHV
jgi:hypothetical protein